MTEPAPLFDAQALHSGFAYLEKLPAAIAVRVLTHPGGALPVRIEGVLALREALLEGELPERLSWPGRSEWDPLRDELRRLDLVRFTQGDECLVDLLIIDLLEALRSTNLRASAALEAVVADRAAQERARRQAAAAQKNAELAIRAARGGLGGLMASAERMLNTAMPTDLSGSELAELWAKATEEIEKAKGQALAKRIDATWADRVKLWASLADVFGDLRSVMGLGWDLTQGVLKHTGWLEIARLGELVARVPALKELVRVLGRMMADKDSPPEIEKITRELRRTTEEYQLVKTPGAPTETRGIERSGSLSRMLPSEAVLLAHPTLKWLWHARRAENALLTYRVSGTYIERVRVETVVTEKSTETRTRPRPARGPILICLDTSGSMSGVPETVAKAVTLESARIAYQENRACHLYGFSGPGQVTEHTLDLSPKGLNGLLGFLTASFGGGTDVTAPMNRALTRLYQAGWERADVLLVSDGEFHAPPDVVAQVKQAKEKQGTRFHGLLIGGHAPAMEALCDPVHRFDDWQGVIGRP